MLANIPQVESKSTRSSWIALCALVVGKEETLESLFGQWLREEGEEVSQDAIDSIMKDNDVFELTTRSVRERRQPKMEPSTLKGIINNGNRTLLFI